MKKSTVYFYDFFARFYPLIDFFLDSQKPILAAEVNKLEPAHILEIGVGNGKHIKLFEKHHFTGIDTSAEMLEKARQYNASVVDLICMDGENLTFANDSFDHVILSHVVSVVDDVDQLLKEAHRVTKIGGKLFMLNHFTPNNWLGAVDRCFQYFAPFFHFKSAFYSSDLKMPDGYTLEKEIMCGKSNYYKLLVFKKV